MSKTLFWYLLKDLFRIFVITSGTLAGIMSFGALLKPLTQHGLDLGQVGRILSYFSPAMTTYSLPIAALFATTIVYGRMSADNELVACRACGISSLMMTAPAFLLGLVVALISLAFLSFVVPVFTLKVEKVIYSNLAQLVANKITRTHEISYGRTSIFAQSAVVRQPTDEVVFVLKPPADKGERKAQRAAWARRLAKAGLTVADAPAGFTSAYGDAETRRRVEALGRSLSDAEKAELRMAYLSPDVQGDERAQAVETADEFAVALRNLPPIGVQIVDLYSPMIFTYETVDAPDPEADAPPKPAAKGERSAAERRSDDRANKMRVPSKVSIAKRATAYISQREDGIELTAVLEECTDFPRGLGGAQHSVGRAQFGPVPMATPIRENTKFMDIAQLKELLGTPESSRKLKATVQQFVRDEQRAAYFAQAKYSLEHDLRSFRMIAETEELVVSGSELDVVSRAGELVITPRPRADTEPGQVHVDRTGNGGDVVPLIARQVRITMEPVEVAPDAPAGAPRRMLVTARGWDVVIDAEEEPAAHEKYAQTVNLPMPESLLQLEQHNVKYFLSQKQLSKSQQSQQLKGDYDKLVASIRAEMHSRASFAVSCFILVMVGAALGMISKSGNFLSAFAVSVAPALLCITLIVTGQHVCENTPKSMGLGLSLIWSGNGIVMILATTLLGKLQRQ